MFVGKNPWQSHGFPRARAILREIAADPERALIVIDPRRTETAELADYHLQVRPGTDAFCLAAMLGVLVQEDLIDHDFLRDARKTATSCSQCCASSGRGLLRARGRRRGLWCARWRAGSPRAASVSVYEDLGIEQAPHSTLNSYLEKLLFALTGNFGKPRRDEHAHQHDRAVRRRALGRRPARSAAIASSAA